MATPIQFDATQHGIYRRFRDSAGYLVSTAWNAACASGEHVGTCRWCGGYLLAQPTHQTGRITWYGARCTAAGCGREIASPNTEMLRRSARHDEMPDGYWLKRLNDMGIK